MELKITQENRDELVKGIKLMSEGFIELKAKVDSMSELGLDNDPLLDSIAKNSNNIELLEMVLGRLEDKIITLEDDIYFIQKKGIN